jgi:arabinofuranan 3-O-arabinosyltransferase
VSNDAAARAPRRVKLTYDGGSTEVSLDDDGRASFPPVRTSFLHVEIVQTDLTTSIGFDQGITGLGTGITDLRIEGAPFDSLTPSQQVDRLPCGSGPDVTVNGVVQRTRVAISPAQVYAGVEVPATPCGAGTGGDPGLRLAAGDNVVRVQGTDVFTATTMTLTDPSFRLDASTPVRWSASDADSRSAEPPADAEFLAFRENGNSGWEAMRNGVDLEPVRVDGWQQGWVLDDSGTGVVTETYAPERVYRAGLVLGAGTLVALALLVLVWTRRPPDASAPAVGTRPVSAWWWLPLSLGTLGVIAGWPGLVLGVVAIGLVRVWRWSDDSLAWLAGGLVGAAGTYYSFHGWGSEYGWGGDKLLPQLLTAFAVALVAAGVLRPTLRSRMAGRSTSR